MTLKNTATNLFNDKSCQYVIASDSRSRIVKTDDGRIYVIIDGEKFSADKNDLFGMNNNPTLWLKNYVKRFDKEAMRKSINEPFEKRVSKLNEKIAIIGELIEESRKEQNLIQKRMKAKRNEFWNFLTECGVHFKSSLNGKRKEKAEELDDEYWNERFALTSENCSEYSLHSEDCSLAYEKCKIVRNISFNDAIFEKFSRMA